MVRRKKHLSLLDLTLRQLEDELAVAGQPAFRARQVFRWVHRHGAYDPQLMTDLPRSLRNQLRSSFTRDALELVAVRLSTDGAVKYVWRTPEGHPVEAVHMPGFEYGTVCCVSCQSGCPLACSFCQTGRLGLHCQLSAGQILHQLYYAEREHGAQADRLVFMGMGEPLLNLKAVRQVTETLTCAEGRRWSPKRITVSTIGLVTPLARFARTFPRVNLALSLHFTTPHQRAQHMPRAERSLLRLQRGLHNFAINNGGKVSLEYMLLANLNDTDADASRLIRFARFVDDARDSRKKHLRDSRQPHSSPLHVNIIEYNPIVGAPQYRPSTPKRVNAFARALRDAGIPVTVRHSRGVDIAGACGMLGSEIKDQEQRR